MSCHCRGKKIETHQVYGPDHFYNGPYCMPLPQSYLYWSTRPLICCTSTDDIKNSWNLKRRVPNIPNIYFQEMRDRDGRRYF